MAIAPTISSDAVDAGADAGKKELTRISPSSRSCTDPNTHADGSAVPASRCVVRGTHAFVFGIVVPLGDGTFIEVGLYGGSAEVDAPPTPRTKTRVKVTEPLELVGQVDYDDQHLVLTHTRGGQVHPTLKLAKGSPIRGVADGDHFRGRVSFNSEFSVGPIDLPCDAIGLGDYNELNTHNPPPETTKQVIPKLAEIHEDPKDKEGLRIPSTPRTGLLHTSWGPSPVLVKESVDATDGLRLRKDWMDGDYGDGSFEVLDRRADHLKIRAHAVGGNELTGWVKTADLSVRHGGGRGEGIGLCGCGTPGHLRPEKEMTIIKGATIHSRPDGPTWAKAITDTKAWISPDDDGTEWRRVVTVDRLSEGGDACPSYKLKNAWVRSSNVKQI